MYLPEHFAQHDPAALRALMQAHPLALLVLHAADGSRADLIPLTHQEPGAGDDARAAPLGRLRGHVARANPLWRQAGSEVLAVFQGPQSYISPGWYPSKQRHGKVVPTWNYTMVQARGRLAAVHDAAWLRALVSGLTDAHEASQPAPWAVDDAPADFVSQLLGAIVGIEITLTQLQGKWKLGQNRDTADREGVRRGLAGSAQGQALQAWVPDAGDR